MHNQKTLLFIAGVLTMASAANADLILTLNGLDAAKEPIVIEAGEAISIGVAGEAETEEGIYDLSITAFGGMLDTSFITTSQEYSNSCELIIDEPNEVRIVTSNPPFIDNIFFEVDDELCVSVLSLITNNDIVVDGIPAPANTKIYQLILFHNDESNTITVDTQALTPPEQGDDVQETSDSEISEPEPELEPEPKIPESTIVPYAQRMEQEKAKHLVTCPAGTGLLTVTESLPVKESRGREIPPGGGRGGMLLGGTTIDVTLDITTNTVWTSDNTYHVLADISVQALLVIEPSTVVQFASGKSMSVNNGGTLISVGTPNSPVIYTSDSGTPWYNDYYCPIYIEETASVSTKVTYSYIEYAYAGIVVLNKRLDTNIENNYLYNNVYGIVEQGIEHTDICNNLIFKSYYSGIEVFLESTTGQADANSHILIENNTCDYYQDCGITVHGVPDSNDAGWVVLANNIVSESYQYGLNLVDGYMYASVLNTGYYDNASNKNWEFDETDPVIETNFPYETGTGWLPVCYLDQDCNFVDAGYQYVEETQIIGKTTDVNELPDSNYVDIGFHYPNWEFSNASDSNSLPADLDGNMKVNFCDFTNFANAWQQSTEEPEDLDGSGFVDFNDLSIFCGQWLDTLSLGVTLDQDPNMVSDVLVLTLVGASDNITCYLFMDGQYFNTFYGDDIAIPTYEYRNGSHELKVVGVNLDDEVLVAPTINITVNNRLHCLTGSEAYKYNQAYQFAGFYEPNDSSTIDFTIKDLDENVIWANSSAGNFNFVISAGILQSPYNDLTIQEVESGKGGDGGDKGGWKSWIKDITKEFDVTSDPNCANARSLLVGVKKGFMGIGDWTYNRRVVWKEYLNACKEGNFAPTICLFFGQATRANIKTAFGLSNVKSIMIITDGRRDWNGVHRTSFATWDGPYFSYLRRNWGGDPNEYEPLPDKYEKGYSVSDLWGSFQQRNKMYVFIDACKNGTSVMNPVVYDICGANPGDNDYSEEEYWRTADMAQAFDIGDPWEQKLYMSWRGFAFKGNPLSKYNSFLWDIWYQVGSRDKTFEYAISHAATYETGNCKPYVNFSWVGNTNIFFDQ